MTTTETRSPSEGRGRRKPRSTIIVTSILVIVALYFLVPIYYIVIAATKTTSDLFATNGFALAPTFALWDNLALVFTYNGGIFVRWLLNSVLYAGVGAALATYFAAAGGTRWPSTNSAARTSSSEPFWAACSFREQL